MPKLYHQDGQWIVPGQQQRHAIRHDIPATPGELADWLNERTIPREAIKADETGGEATPPPTAIESAAAMDATTITEWIMDTATPAQVEQCFAALGVSFHQLRRETAQTDPGPALAEPENKL